MLPACACPLPNEIAGHTVLLLLRRWEFDLASRRSECAATVPASRQTEANTTHKH